MIPATRTFQPAGESDPKSTANDIGKLIYQLIELYKNEFKYQEFPVQLLQFAHINEILLKIQEDIKTDPIKTLKIQEAFLKKWTSLQVITFNKLMGIE